MILRSARILVVALLVAGCAAPGSPRSSGDVEPFPPTAEVENLRLPFDAYTLSLAGLYIMANAQDVLTRECMAARGHDWEIIERPTDLKDLRNRRRYGVIEMSIAERFGFHVPAGLLTPLDVEQRYDRRDNALSESQQAAVSGADGCGREAATRLRPEKSADLDLLRKLDRASLDDSQREQRVVVAMDAWRDCVRSLGFDYQDPFAAMSDPRWWAADAAAASNEEAAASSEEATASSGESTASSEERAVAVAVVRCEEQTDLVAVWHAAEVKIQEEEIRRHPDYFRDLRAATEAELAAAEAVLANSKLR
ncbi:hypothetical protein ACQEVC_44695 [Plantactinospora sp. CA-294935]|uniref:hypothetical protein n=1 Tax=Plantactinospora sp. CA-294935 TaxID=3240012 RepID=UPI003D8D137E